MASIIRVSVEKMFDRGPEYGFLEVQVNFEWKGSATKGPSFASVIVSLPKAKVGSMPFDDIRAMARSYAVEFMEECVKTYGGK